MALAKLSRSVKDNIVIITGAASGMGRATAHVFADQGARLALLDMNVDALQAVVDEVNADGGEAKGWSIDLSDRAAIAPVVHDIAEHFGGVDVLVNNAGISIPAPLADEHYDAAWDKSIAVLLTAQVSMIRAALPFIRQSQNPRIINIASTEALGATKFGSPYTAAKSGVVGLTRSMAVELGGEGITVNCVCPGPIHTGMTAGIPDEQKEIFAKRRTVLKRYADPEEVAHATLSLALPAAQYITGVTLPVDGGLTIRNA
ncbi:MAG: SDR family NAD(P)-dependent oxidoreductase [Pseudomonadales bacterium]|jgi:3-oxoacyl-[acyl-carrier protein] reductase